MSKTNKWAIEQNEQMSKHFYSFMKMIKHVYFKMSKMNKWVNEQNAHMSKFGIKWATEFLIYYKNAPGCTMLMVHPGVPWVNSLNKYLTLPNSYDVNPYLLFLDSHALTFFLYTCDVSYPSALSIRLVISFPLFTKKHRTVLRITSSIS